MARFLFGQKFVAQDQISWINSFAISESSARVIFKRREIVRFSLSPHISRLIQYSAELEQAIIGGRNLDLADLAQNCLTIKDLQRTFLSLYPAISTKQYLDLASAPFTAVPFIIFIKSWL